MSAEEFFHKHYEAIPESGCWVWNGAIGGRGYGTLTVDGRTSSAHRYSYRLHKGEIPSGMLVCHRCDVKSCVNPEHLFIGTALDNTSDMFRKGRFRKGRVKYGEESHLSKLTRDQVNAIRILYSTGKYSQRDLAAAFEVTQGTIGFIVQGKTWK